MHDSLRVAGHSNDKHTSCKKQVLGYLTKRILTTQIQMLTLQIDGK